VQAKLDQIARDTGRQPEDGTARIGSRVVQAAFATSMGLASPVLAVGKGILSSGSIRASNQLDPFPADSGPILPKHLLLSPSQKRSTWRPRPATGRLLTRVVAWLKKMPAVIVPDVTYKNGYSSGAVAQTLGGKGYEYEGEKCRFDIR
jgi:hypothetical protein